MLTPDGSRTDRHEEPELSRALETLRLALDDKDGTSRDAPQRVADTDGRILGALLRVVLALAESDANVTKALTELARLPLLASQQLDVCMKSHEALSKRILALEARSRG